MTNDQWPMTSSMIHPNPNDQWQPLFIGAKWLLTNFPRGLLCCRPQDCACNRSIEVASPLARNDKELATSCGSITADCSLHTLLFNQDNVGTVPRTVRYYSKNKRCIPRLSILFNVAPRGMHPTLSSDFCPLSSLIAIIVNRCSRQGYILI